MSSWYNGKWKCFICEFDTPVQFKRPQLLCPSNIFVKCRGCESKFRVSYQRKQKAKRHEFVYQSTPIQLSLPAVEILKEIEAEKNGVLAVPAEAGKP